MLKTRIEATDVAEDESAFVPLSIGMLFFIPIVLAGNEVGAVLRYPELGSAVLFPPYAALTAALVTSPRRYWIWYILIAALAHAAASLSHWPLSWVLFADVANIARALVAATMLRWFFKGIPRIDSILALGKFVVSAVLIGPAIGATIGAANIVLHGASPTYMRPWTLWYVSNALTALTMLPGLLAATTACSAWRLAHAEPRRGIEAVVLAFALGVTCLMIFLSTHDSGGDVTWLLYAPLPLLMWAALQFGSGGASLALTAVAGVAIWGADRGTGPFASTATNDNVLSLQLFLFLTSVPVLSIAAVATGRRGAVQLYSALLASLQEHVAILDAHGMVMEVNSSWRQFASTHRGDAFDGVHAGDDYLSACRTSIEHERSLGVADKDIFAVSALSAAQRVLSGEERLFETEHMLRDGTGEWYTLRIEALERPDGGVVVTRSNVSARHHAQAQIAEQRRELSHLGRVAVLGELTGSFAHELRQPLSAILANAEAAQHLLRHAPFDAELLLSIVDDIAAEDRRAALVIDGLRSLLKRGESRMQPVDPEALIGEVLTLAHADLVARRVSLTSDIQANLPPLLADRVQIQQVLLNLIVNGSDAMSGLPPAERAMRITVSSTAKGEVHFAVRDAGTGIPADVLDRLFESFVTTKSDGLGLGLSISRSIVVAHGGRIWAENNDGSGATLHCVFASAGDQVAPRLPLPTIGVEMRADV